MIFGVGRFDSDLDARMRRLVRWSNRGVRSWWDFMKVRRRIARHLDQAQQHASHPDLVCRYAGQIQNPTPSQNEDALSQIMFWLFVLRDAIELHAARTLALIAVHEPVQERLRQELTGYTGGHGGAWPFLQACIKEQLRLWTAVPLLLRRAVDNFTLRNGTQILRGDVVLMHAGFYHRDGQFLKTADRFSPEDRLQSDCPSASSVSNSDPPLFVFSQGRQSCAGQFLAMFVIEAVLRCLLAETRNLKLVAPALATGAVPTSFNHFEVHLADV